MKTKQKVAIIAIVSVLLLTVIGLAIGIVLVAQQATMNNSMTISYKANNVDVSITATAKRFDSDTDTGSVLNITQNNNAPATEVTVDINASDTAEQIAAKGSLVFAKAENVTANGKAVYTFKITNTATVSASNTRELKVEATAYDTNLDSTPSFANNGNVRTKIGTAATASDAETLATTMTENITKSTANVGVAGSTIYLVVVMSVDDATMDVVDYNLSLDLKFDYGKTTENPNGIAQDDWDGTVGTLPTPITATSNATLFNQYVTEFNMNRSTDRTQMADVDTIYVIKTAEELAAISAGMPEGSSTETYYYATGGTISAFVLEADIDLKNIPWTPIGYGYRTNAQKNFNGIGFGGDFYGNGHTIRNISIEKAGTQYGGTTDSNTAVGIGFFGNLYASKIVGLTLANIKVTGNQYVGAVAGYALSPSTSPEKSGRGEITDCHVTDAEVSCICANTEESGDKAGAICGYFSQTTIKNCSAYDCAVDADRDAGMLLGCLHKALDTYFTAYIFTDNIAHNVTVKSNNTGKVVLGDSYTKSGGNIGLHENGLIGRI